MSNLAKPILGTGFYGSSEQDRGFRRHVEAPPESMGVALRDPLIVEG